MGTHGILGELRIQPWSDNAEFLLPFETLYIGGKPMKVKSLRVHKSLLLAMLEGIEDVNSAMRMVGKVVSIDRSDASLPEGSVFIVDLVGLEVKTEEGRPLGRLSEVLTLPANDVYVIKGESEILIPAVTDFVKEINTEAGYIIVRLIEGMETNAN